MKKYKVKGVMFTTDIGEGAEKDITVSADYFNISYGGTLLFYKKQSEPVVSGQWKSPSAVCIRAIHHWYECTEVVEDPPQ